MSALGNLLKNFKLIIGMLYRILFFQHSRIRSVYKIHQLGYQFFCLKDLILDGADKRQFQTDCLIFKFGPV